MRVTHTLQQEPDTANRSLSIGTHLGYRPDIDGMRAVSVISVLIFHINPKLLPGGFVGVDVFFVISGYLISGIIFRQLMERSFKCIEFYVRRVMRIFPALVLVLVATWAFGWLISLSSEFQILGRQIVAGSTFSYNFVVFLDQEWYFAPNGSNPLVHLWSLGVEEQFYIFWPLFLLAIWKLKRTPFPILFSLTLGSFMLNLEAASTDPLASYYLPWNRLWELSSGAMLAYGEMQGSGNLNGVFRKFFSWLHGTGFSGSLGASLLFLSFVAIDGSGRTPFPGWWGLIPCAGALLLISAKSQCWIKRNVLATRPLVFVGLISYPLYLWHLPLLATVRTLGYTAQAVQLGVVALAALLSVVTYKYVELPLRSSSRRYQIAAGLGTLMAICASFGYSTLAGAIPARSAAYSIDRYVRPATEDWLRNSQRNEQARSFRWTLSVDGLLFVGDAPRRVLFIGDSTMQQYYPRIEKILSENPKAPRSAAFAIRAACVPGGVELQEYLDLPQLYTLACRRLLQNALDYARAPAVDIVVISGNWHRYFATDAPKNDAAGADRYRWRPGSENALRKLRQTVSSLTQDGKQVYVILGHPFGEMFDPRQMINRGIFPPAFTVEKREFVPREVSRVDGIITEGLRQIATRSKATAIDTSRFFCDEEKCRALTPDGEPIYHDSGHLRPSYVRDNVFFLDDLVLSSGADSANEESTELSTSQ